jgi:hypothetical protein
LFVVFGLVCRLVADVKTLTEERRKDQAKDLKGKKFLFACTKKPRITAGLSR